MKQLRSSGVASALAAIVLASQLGCSGQGSEPHANRSASPYAEESGVVLDTDTGNRNLDSRPLIRDRDEPGTAGDEPAGDGDLGRRNEDEGDRDFERRLRRVLLPPGPSKRGDDEPGPARNRAAGKDVVDPRGSNSGNTIVGGSGNISGSGNNFFEWNNTGTGPAIPSGGASQDGVLVVKVPDLLKLSLGQAKRKLREEGLLLPPGITASDGAEVVAQYPSAGTKLVKGATIGLYFKGALVSVPNVLHGVSPLAIEVVQLAGLSVHVKGVKVSLNTIVKSQSLRAGTQVSPGTQITLTLVPQPPAPPPVQWCVVPNVVGRRAIEAAFILNSVGLRFRGNHLRHPNTVVGRQLPPAGSRVKFGSVVDAYRR
jgi:hypothetical protein